MKWFKHDTDASIDAKLQTLLLDYGAAGYGLYWYCVELIAQSVTENNITFELEHDARIIARNLSLTIQETKDMIKKMVELDLFFIAKNEKLACYALAKRLDRSMTSNQHFREIITQIRENHDFLPNNHDSVMTQSTANHDSVMQEEKRREEKRIEENKKSVSAPPPKKQSSDDLLIEELKKEITLSDNGIDLVRRFLKYRRILRKQIKTVKPIKSFVAQMALCKKEGFDVEEVFNLMEEKQWASVSLEWVLNSKPKEKQWSDG